MTQTVDIISQGETSLHLVNALLMYRSDRGDVYATSHKIEIDANAPNQKVIGAGVPLTKKSLAAFARAVNVATTFAGFIPSNLLYTSPNLIAWWAPAALRNTWFKECARGIGTVAGVAAHPAMVFVATPGNWYVFAVRESTRPEAQTQLLHSPHFNVWDGGRICTGNVNLPAAVDAEAIAAYEDAFFRSHFTHPNRLKAVKYRGGMTKLWADQLANPNPEAMAAALVPAKETLTAAIHRISTTLRNKF